MAEEDVQNFDPLDSSPSADISTENNEAVKEVQEVSSPEENTTETPKVVKSQEVLLDEKGVPLQNRAKEYERKLEKESQEKLAIQKELQEVKEAINNIKQTVTPKQVEYTIEQLEHFKMDNPEYAGWVEEEKAKIIRKRTLEDFKALTRESEEQKAVDVARNSSLNYVVTNFKEAFVCDNTGKAVSWNNNSPLTKEIATLMQDPQLAKNPQGLSIAADIAYGRVIRNKLAQTAEKQTQLKDQVRTLQKQTFTEGGGAKAAETASNRSKALSKAYQTGTIKDAANAMKYILNKA